MWKDSVSTWLILPCIKSIQMFKGVISQFTLKNWAKEELHFHIMRNTFLFNSCTPHIKNAVTVYINIQVITWLCTQNNYLLWLIGSIQTIRLLQKCSIRWYGIFHIWEDSSSTLFKVKFLFPAKKTPTIIDKNFKIFNKKAQLAVSKHWLYFSCSSLGLLFCTVVLKLLLLPLYCEAPEPEHLEAQPSLKALYTPRLWKRTPVLLGNLLS